jgi:uncharacterized protein (DUF433 family)
MSSAVAERRCKDLSYHRYRSLERKRGDDLWRMHGDECSATEKDFDVPFSFILEKASRDFPSITVDHKVLSGTPRIAGTRIPVYMVLDAVEYYGTLDGALRSYPDLTLQQVKDALSFAGTVLEYPIEHKSETFA